MHNIGKNKGEQTHTDAHTYQNHKKYWKKLLQSLETQYIISKLFSYYFFFNSKEMQQFVDRNVQLHNPGGKISMFSSAYAVYFHMEFDHFSH